MPDEWQRRIAKAYRLAPDALGLLVDVDEANLDAAQEYGPPEVAEHARHLERGIYNVLCAYCTGRTEEETHGLPA